MLHYSIDNEIAMNFYQAYRQLPEKSPAAVQALALPYLPLTEKYPMEERTVLYLRGFAAAADETQLTEAENLLVHAYLAAKGALKDEQAAYRAFTECFEGTERLALEGLAKYVLGDRIIPYKIKNRGLHITILSTPAFSMEVDFEDVLIEDGRHPREIRMTHISGEQLTQERQITGKDGSRETVNERLYRITFVNNLTEDPYQARECAFIFRNVRGSIHFYDYFRYYQTEAVLADKLPWHLLLASIQALLEKQQVFGREVLSRTEKAYLPVLSVFYELIYFYLDPASSAGIGRSMISYDEVLTESFSFTQKDLDGICHVLESRKGFTDLTEHMAGADADRPAFYRYWIHYLSIRKSQRLWRYLRRVLRDCAREYPEHMRPVAFRKYVTLVRGECTDFAKRHGFLGSYPDFYRPEEINFLEVSNVYSKMYTYINEKQKATYLSLIESFDEDRYVIHALSGYAILREGDEAGEHTAMDGYFLDGGRRVSHLIGSIAVDEHMTDEAIREGLRRMLEDAAARAMERS